MVDDTLTPVDDLQGVIVKGGTGSRGPARLPLILLQKRASRHARHREEPTIEAAPGPALKLAPSDRLTPSARHHWNILLPLLEAMRVVTRVDVPALERLCELKTLADRTLYALYKSGITVEMIGPTGEVDGYKDRPEMGRYLKLAEVIGRLEQQFGLTPAARSRVASVPEEKTNKKTIRRSRMMDGGL